MLDYSLRSSLIVEQGQDKQHTADCPFFISEMQLRAEAPNTIIKPLVTRAQVYYSAL